MNDEKHPLQEILENAGYEVRSYSGRGMYGVECLDATISPSNVGQLIADVIDAVIELTESIPDSDGPTNVDDVSKAFKSFRQDSMGYDVIVYWEKVKFFDEDESED